MKYVILAKMMLFIVLLLLLLPSFGTSSTATEIIELSEENPFYVIFQSNDYHNILLRINVTATDASSPVEIMFEKNC